MMADVQWPESPGGAIMESITFGRPIKPPRKRTFRDDLAAHVIGAFGLYFFVVYIINIAYVPLRQSSLCPSSLHFESCRSF
jgi:hypothetical protein